jgi:uncharacterized membrane protein
VTTRGAIIACLTVTLVTLAYGLILAPSLPDRVPIHWNIRGEVDGYGSKWIAILMVPAMMVFFTGLAAALPAMSPENFDIETFRPTFNYVFFTIIVLLSYIQLVTLQAAQHPHTDVGKLLMVGICVSFGFIGNVLGKVRRNFWMGIRTPWTLASDEVWTATHRFAARLMFACGILGAVLALLGAPFALLIGLILFSTLVPAVQSYFVFRKLGGDPHL